MPKVLMDTVFPTAHDKDLQMNIRILKEKYQRFYPKLDYKQMNLGIPDPQEGDVPATPPPVTVTEIDDLWGEPVPNGELPGLAWENPHSTLDLDATEGDKRLPGIEINAHVNHQPSKKVLGRFGIDEQRVMVVTFLVPLLEEAGITVRHGDRFFWKNFVFEVLHWQRMGYWKDTSVHLYIETAVRYARYGS